MTRTSKNTIRTLVAMAFMLPSIGNAQATDPSKGRLDLEERRAKLAKYDRCARYTLNNFNVCLRRAGLNQSQIRQCQRTYQNYMEQCRKHLS